MEAVYCIRAGETPRVKIGWSACPQQRLATLQVANPEKLRIIRLIHGPKSFERWFHNRFKEHRGDREWFHFHPDMLTAVPPESEEKREKRARVVELQEAEDWANSYAGVFRLSAISLIVDLQRQLQLDDEQVRQIAQRGRITHPSGDFRNLDGQTASKLITILRRLLPDADITLDELRWWMTPCQAEELGDWNRAWKMEMARRALQNTRSAA